MNVQKHDRLQDMTVIIEAELNGKGKNQNSK